MRLPEKTSVLVMGGGPAGATAATFLAREGVEVLLVERDRFPRYHIGESLLPSCLEILELLGARELTERQGFQRKPGAYLDWKGERWSLDFGELGGEYRHSFQVPRAQFDHMLLQHGRSQGVRVFEGTGVGEIKFTGRLPTSALCTNDGVTQEVKFDHLIDASGRAGILSNRYLQNRKYHKSFQNVAFWGYWDGVERLPGDRAGAIAVGSIPSGWIWAIPFSDGQMSIGVVMEKSTFKAERETYSLREIYSEAIAGCPLMAKMTAGGTLSSELRTEQDYSYNAEVFAAPGYFLAGDSACFLDPLLSTGVHLAMYSGMLAAASLASTLRGEITQEEAVEFYEQSYRQAYLRLLVFVSAFYESRGKDGYYRTAEKLSHFDADPSNIRRAFLNLVSGLEDIADVENTTTHLMGEMSKRIRENLELRSQKESLGARRASAEAGESLRFFNAVEGLTSLSAEHAVAGFFVRTKPNLGLNRVKAREAFAAAVVGLPLDGPVLVSR